MKRITTIALLAAATLVLLAQPASAQRAVIDVESETRGLYPIAVPVGVNSDRGLAKTVSEVLSFDLKDAGWFKVLDPRSFLGNLKKERLSIDPPKWKNVGAFGVVLTVAHQSEERLQIEDYAGFGWQQPLMGVFLTIFLLSLAGFPGTGGFIGKIFLLQGAVDSNLWTLAVVLVLATVVSYWYYLRVAWFMWMREAPEADTHASIFAPLSMRVALFGAAGIILLLGIFPSAFGFLDFVQASVDSLTNVGGLLGQLVP